MTRALSSSTSAGWRSAFPGLGQKVHGKPLVYLDNAATTQKPASVVEAVRRFYLDDCANVHRGLHELSARATAAFEEARATVQRFLGAERTSEVVFTSGVTGAINLVAHSFGASALEPGDEIVVSEMEHHSNIVPWQLLCERHGARLRVARVLDSGELDLDHLTESIGDRAKLVAVPHVSNVLGTVNPVREIARIAHRKGARLLVDGAQAAAHLALDVGELDCDFYAISGHKMYAPMGIGALWGRQELLEAMPPFLGGGEMIRSVAFDGTTFAPPPARFEAGTPNVGGAIGLAAAIRFLDELGFDSLARAERELCDAALRRFDERKDIRLLGRASERVAVFSFTLDGIHPHDAATILDQEGIAVRAGHHCAEPLMRRFGVPATLRASFACYNDASEIDALFRGLDRVFEVFA